MCKQVFNIQCKHCALQKDAPIAPARPSDHRFGRTQKQRASATLKKLIASFNFNFDFRVRISINV